MSSAIPSLDVALRELEAFLRQKQQLPVRTAGATIRAIRPDVHRVLRSASERPGKHWS